MKIAGQGGVTLDVTVSGPDDGPPVLLLHGWPDSHTLWRHQVAALSAAGFRTIAPDLRGFGASDKPDHVAAYALTNTVADMVAVLDHLGVERVRLVAHDWGAAAGWGMTGFVPDRVDRYAAISVGHPAAFSAAGFEQRMRSLYMLLFNVPVVAEQFMDHFGRQLLATHPDRDEVLALMAEPGAMTAGFGWYRANANPRSIVSPPPRIPAAACPVMGVWSSADVALTEKQMLGSTEHVTGPWRYERLDGIGHWIPVEAPEALNALLLDFLS